jgi:hypothetical protein
MLLPSARAKKQDIVGIVLEPYGDDSRQHTRSGNPQRLFHNGETPENPPRVWTLKRLPAPAAE